MRNTDAELQQEVLRELEWDTRVAETEVGVSVDAAVVTLTGTVSSWAKRVAAAEAAHRVRGVRDVANDLQVKLPGSPGRNDTDIAHAVRHALEWDALVPHERIRSTVSDGQVTLEGEVDNGSQRNDAQKAIRSLSGVTGIENKIVVRTYPYNDHVQRSIEAALARRAQREALRVHVEVKDGCALLTGAVQSWPAWRLVHDAATDTPGVLAVDDQIQIDPALE